MRVNLNLSDGLFFQQGSRCLDDVPTLSACILMLGIKVQEKRGRCQSRIEGPAKRKIWKNAKSLQVGEKLADLDCVHCILAHRAACSFKDRCVGDYKCLCAFKRCPETTQIRKC